MNQKAVETQSLRKVGVVEITETGKGLFRMCLPSTPIWRWYFSATIVPDQYCLALGAVRKKYVEMESQNEHTHVIIISW